MGTRRLVFSLLLPAALVLLLTALAGLQYRWLGQVSEAERAEMRAALERRVQSFSEDFDRELAHAFFVFRKDSSGIGPADAETIAARREEWRATARFPALIRDIYFLHASDDQWALFLYEPARRTLDPVDWPASLAPLRGRLGRPMPPREAAIDAAPPGARTAVVINAGSFVLPEVPAVVVPIAGRTSDFAPVDVPRGIANVTMALRHDSSSVILDLDSAYIRGTMLPALAGQHFLEGDRYDLAILDSHGETIYRRAGADRPLAAAAADARAPLFLLRFDTIVNDAGGAPGASLAPAAPRPATVQRRTAEGLPDGRVLGAAAWQALLWHAAGSLDAAVAEARHRNLWLSFGILAVLAASAALIVVNARRSERLAAQQMAFVAAVSHELRTPVAVINSTAGNLADDLVGDPADVRTYGAMIQREARRLGETVERVLQLAGLDAARGRPERTLVPAETLVRESIEACGAEIARVGAQVEVDVAPDLPAVVGDPAALRSAVRNLVENACKYSDAPPWVRVSASAQGGQVSISVEDRGFGIAAADRRHVFEPFYRGREALARRIHGSGLGLSLVARIVEAHGGRVTLESEPGRGSRVTLHLPGSAAPPAAAPAAHRLRPAHPVE